MLEGHWEVALPHRSSVNLTVKDSDLVPCWQQKMGLVGDEWKNKMVHSTLEVSFPAEDVDKLERHDISSTYALFDKCGAPRSYLFKRNVDNAGDNLPPVSFFPNPGRCTDPKDDGYLVNAAHLAVNALSVVRDSHIAFQQRPRHALSIQRRKERHASGLEANLVQ